MSLRWRLMLSVGLVVLAAVGAVAYISSRVVRVELNQLSHRVVAPQAWKGAARDVAAHYSRSGREDLEALLARVRDERFPRSELVMLDRERRLLAASAPLGGNVEIDSGPDGTTQIRFGSRARRSTLLVKGAAVDVEVPGQGVIGSLLVTPRWDPRADDPMRSVNRWLLLAVALVGAAALGFTALVARRVIAPIERLQEATARVRGDTAGDSLPPAVPVTSRDEVGQLAEAFNAMTERLRQHEQLRRNMVNDVAHELRTPLTNLRASIEAIQDGLRSPDAGVIDALHDDVLLLQRLVEDLQTLALAEAGKLPLHLEEVDLRDELQRFIRAQGEPRLHLHAEPGWRVSVDRARLHQILSNLVRNAQAHIGADGRIEIAVTDAGASASRKIVAPPGDAPPSVNGVRLSVSDDGTGIPAADLPHIFDRFYRADSSRARATGGAGLGLAIVRHLVEIQRGTITVESEEGRGARFHIDLPR